MNQPIAEQSVACCVCHTGIRPMLRAPWTIPDGRPICLACLAQRPYKTANTRCLGDPDGLPSFSVEFEVCACGWLDRTVVRRAWALLPYGFLRTNDDSVDDEYKSPIYQSYAAFEPVLPVLRGLGNLVDDCCGTHIHIACPRKHWVHQYAEEVFGPLVTYWATHPNETLAFWGRCHAPCKGDVATATRHETVEFRLPHFRSAAQYLAIIRYCRQAGKMLNERTTLVTSRAAFAQAAPLLGADLLAHYQETCASVLATPTWKVRSTFLFARA